jgi:glucose/arabinose dehydrogenase
VPGGSYGWNPVPGYDESKPMTDFTLPGKQYGAKWSSGFPTIAPSGATWLYDKLWGDWQGRLFMSVMGAQSSRVFDFGPQGHLLSEIEPPELDGTYGRIRGATLGPDGAVYLSTDNGGGTDVILRLTPA